MVLHAAFLLATSTPATVAVPLIELTRQDCPAPTFDKEKGDIGDRAIISDDGTKIVVQCGNGVVKYWQSGESTFKPIGVIPLIRAAQLQGIVPDEMLCPWPSIIGDSANIEADCDILDHDDVNSIYVLKNIITSFAFVVSGKKVLQESTVWQKFGALLPGKPMKLAIVNGERRPELLQSLATKDGTTTLLARLPNPSLIFEDGEGRAEAVAYSPSTGSLIVSFSGAFRVATEMTYVRAFDEKGVEQWRITAKLPPRSDTLIVGDDTKLTVFASGRYALLAKMSLQNACDLIDLRNGVTTSSIQGWPLAASRNATVVLVKGANDTLSLVRLDLGT